MIEDRSLSVLKLVCLPGETSRHKREGLFCNTITLASDVNVGTGNSTAKSKELRFANGKIYNTYLRCCISDVNRVGVRAKYICRKRHMGLF